MTKTIKSMTAVIASTILGAWLMLFGVVVAYSIGLHTMIGVLIGTIIVVGICIILHMVAKQDRITTRFVAQLGPREEWVLSYEPADFSAEVLESENARIVKVTETAPYGETEEWWLTEHDATQLVDTIRETVAGDPA